MKHCLINFFELGDCTGNGVSSELSNNRREHSSLNVYEESEWNEFVKTLSPEHGVESATPDVQTHDVPDDWLLIVRYVPHDVWIVDFWHMDLFLVVLYIQYMYERVI